MSLVSVRRATNCVRCVVFVFVICVLGVLCSAFGKLFMWNCVSAIRVTRLRGVCVHGAMCLCYAKCVVCSPYRDTCYVVREIIRNVGCVICSAGCAMCYVRCAIVRRIMLCVICPAKHCHVLFGMRHNMVSTVFGFHVPCGLRFVSHYL